MTLSDEIKTNKKKTFQKKFIFILLFICISYFIYSYFFQKEVNKKVVDTKTFSVKKSDLKTFIESDWNVIIKDEFNLDFQIDWVIKNIYKKEWDFVEKLELIADLDDTYLSINIEKAQLALNTAKTNYEIKSRWTSQDEIDIQSKQVDANVVSIDSLKSILEIDLKNALENEKLLKTSLENTKKQNAINVLNAENNLEIAKIDLESNKNSLELTTSQEQEKYENTLNKLVMEAWQLISIYKNNLFDIDLLLWISDINKSQNDSYELYLWSKNTSLKQLAENSYIESKLAFDNFYKDWESSRQSNDLEKLEEYSVKLKEVWSLINKSINNTIDVLKNSIYSTTFLQTTIDNYIIDFEKALSDNKNSTSTFASFILNNQESITTSDLKIDSTKNQVLSYEQKLKTAQFNYDKIAIENDISLSIATQKLEQAENLVENTKIKNESLLSKENSSLDISKTVLDSKKQIDYLELEPYRVAILLAQKNLEEAQKKKQDSMLYSPLSWKIVDISWKALETTGWLKSPFITIINDKTMFVESFVEEWSITKIKNFQDVNLTFDSIDWLTLTWTVVYINDKANIDSNWVVTYEVRILFEVADTRVKDSMSTTIEFITKEKKNVLVIPVQAVKTRNNKPSVMLENWEYKEVITWFTDWKMVEIISWLDVWQKLIY